MAEAMHGIGGLLSAELDRQKLVSVLTDEATRLIGAEVGAFFYNVTDDQEDSYTLSTLSGADRDAFERFPMPRKTALFAPTFEGLAAIRLDDVTEDPRYGRNAPHHGLPEGHLPIRSYLAVPVVSRGGEVLGGLFFGHSRVGVFDVRDEQLIVGIAAQAAIAIDNARLYQEAQESEQRFRQMAEHLSAVFYIAEPHVSHVFYISPAYQTVWGRSCESLYERPLSFLESVHPEDRERVRETMERQVRGEMTAETYRIVRPDGAVRWVWDRGYPIRNESDEVARITGIVEDITERRHAEEAVRAGEERLRLALEAGHMGTWEWDIAAGTVNWSPGLERIHGLEPGMFPGTFEAYQYDMHPDDRQRVLDSITRAVEQEAEHHIEYRLVWPDGSVHWIEARGRLFRDEAGRPARMIGICMDIDERKHLEAELRRRVAELAEAEQRTRSVVDHVVDGIITINDKGIVETYNPAAERIFGYKADEVVGRNVSLLMPEPFHGKHDRYISDYLRTGQAKVIGIGREVEGRRKDGSVFPLDLAASEFRIEGQRFFTGIVRDISERKRAVQTTRFLADASASLASLVDYESTLQTVARLAVPFFADWCAVDMAGPDGSVRRLAVVHVDPQKVELAKELQRRYPPNPDEPYGVPHVLRTGTSELGSEISDELIEQAAQDEEHLRLLRELGLKSYICVPLRSRQGVLGVLTFVSAESKSPLWIGRSFRGGRPGAPRHDRHRKRPALPGTARRRPPQG